VRTYLNVPFSEKDEAKRLGAIWDIARSKWYVENKDNLKPFLKWIDERLKQPTAVAIPPPFKPSRHIRPDHKKPGKQANKERLRQEREALKQANNQQSTKG
jgi:putative DNA primase/helicase